MCVTKMICEVVLKCVVFLHVVAAIPLGNDEYMEQKVQDLRMASPSYVRSLEIPTSHSDSFAGHTIFNAPIPDLKPRVEPIFAHAPQVPAKPQYSNSQNNKIIINQIKQPQSEMHPVYNLNQVETKYLQNPYESINILPQLQQAVRAETYQNINRRAEYTQTPNTAPRRQELYQGSSTLQKLLSNPSLVRNIISPKQAKKQFILVYPNGTIGYEDSLSTVSNKYPNHLILSSNELQRLSNIDDQEQPSVQTKEPLNVTSNILKTTPDSGIKLTSYTHAQQNLDSSADRVINEDVNVRSSTNITQNIQNNTMDLKVPENEYIIMNTANNTDNLQVLNQTVAPFNTNNIAVSTTHPEGSNVTTINTNQEYSSQNTTKLTEVSVLNNPNKTVPSNIMPENSTSFDKTSNITQCNAANGTKYTSPVGDEGLSNNDTPNYVAQESTTAANTNAIIIQNTNTYEPNTTEVNTSIVQKNTEIEDTVQNSELTVAENECTDDCQCCENDTIANETGIGSENSDNTKQDGTNTVSWTKMNKDDAKRLLFGDEEDSPNIFFIFYDPTDIDVEKETKTNTYPNGTVVEEYIEIRRMADGTTLRTSTTKTYNSIPPTSNTSENG